MSRICKILLFASLACFAAPVVSAQTKQTGRKPAQTKRIRAARKKPPMIITSVGGASAQNDDAICGEMYQSYNSTEGNFDVCFPNPPQNKKLADFLKQKSDVLQTPLGEIPSTQLLLDTPIDSYIVVWYDLPEIIEGAEQTRQMLEKLGFLKLKQIDADVLSADKQKLGKWFERSFECVGAPGGDFNVCIKERFFINGKRLYRVAAMSQNSSRKTSKTINERVLDNFLVSFRVFNPKSN